MTSAARNELLALIEAVCEQTATREQCARLEQLVLSDPENLRLYVRAMELHGLLHWDAGGIGSVHELPVWKEAPPQAPRPFWKRWIAGLSLVLICGAAV